MYGDGNTLRCLKKTYSIETFEKQAGVAELC